jgi:hypothetical protein
MGKEFNTVETNNKDSDKAVEQPVTELNDLSLALVGGGGAIVSF